jgi:SAM-dependent methyltransferase
VSEALYDTIGKGYAELRRPDPRIQAQIVRALGDSRTVLNVGAGTGSYEPADRRVIAVDLSMEMVRQRKPGSAPIALGDATRLPFRTNAFDAALATFTVHHWPAPLTGLTEMRRVSSRRVVVLTHFIPEEDFWLINDYLPPIADDLYQFVSEELIRQTLDVVDIEVVPVPSDCVDGFLACYWARPEAYLDARIRSGISLFAFLDPVLVDECLERLRSDIESGVWDRRYGQLRTLDERDFGYRLVIANV